MKRIVTTCLSVYLLISTTSLFAADIKTGWSRSTKIEQVSNDAEYIFYKLKGQNDGCGNTQLWRIATDGVAKNSVMIRFLDEAKFTDKEVSFLCEKGVVTNLTFLDKGLQKRYRDKQSEIYIKNANAHLMKSMADNKQYQQSLTPAQKRKKERKRKRFYKLMAARAADITFFGQVIDQYGDPVAGVVVGFYGSGGYMVEGSGFDQVQTDEQGFFHIEGAKGTALSIKGFSKVGYQIKAAKNNRGIVFDSHQRFSDSILFSSHSTKDSAYIFKAWKQTVIPTPSNILSGAYHRSFIRNAKYYWVDFSVDRGRQTRVESTDALRIQFSEDDQNYFLNLAMPGGGLLETDDYQYMYLAPETGYLSEYNYSFKKSKRGHPTIIKHFYFKTGLQDLFGKVKMKIRIDFSEASGYIAFLYSTNLDHTRDLFTK